MDFCGIMDMKVPLIQIKSIFANILLLCETKVLF